MPSSNQFTPKNRLLAAMSRDDLRRFFTELDPLSFSIRQAFYEAGAPIEYVYFIEEGVASVLTNMVDGSTIEVGMIGAEGMVGVSALLGGDTAVQQVIMQVPGSALRMDAARCKAAFNQSEAVRTVALRFVDGLLNLSAQTAACNRLHSIEQRCARWLLMALDRIQSERMPSTQEFPVTHEFLASMLGVRRAGVTTIAGELQRSGLIRYHHGRISIVDRDGLEANACECYRMDHDRLLQMR